MADKLFDFGMVGLGTMGKNLALNIADHGHSVAGYARSQEKADAFSVLHENVLGIPDYKLFVTSIRKPRAIMILVPAGEATDQVIAELKPFLEPADFIIDGGNAYFKDTDRRLAALKAEGFDFMGMGVSGGESGARRGPSMMPGGSQESYARVQPILESVAAHFHGEPCVALMGAKSAGHYVKMVHNGIEYAIMQLISETYDLMHRGQGRSNSEIADVFEKWNDGSLQGFLTQITVTVLRYKDEKTGGDLVDLISDKAKSKGTGKWTSQDAFDLGIPVPTIDAAVSARELSGYKADRTKISASAAIPPMAAHASDDDIHDALLAGMLLAYAQGLALIRAASDEYGYGVDLAKAAAVWRAGCIIRSAQLEPIRAAVARDPHSANLLLDEEFRAGVIDRRDGLRRIAMAFIQIGIPAPAHQASLAYLDGYSSARLPANLIQGQRDLFGAHTYERLDAEGSFHTQWEPA